MLSTLAPWLLLCASIFLTAALTLYRSLSTVLQVSNGYSLLDDDASPGQRLRKQFLLFFLAPQAFLRVASTVLEVIFFSSMHSSSLLPYSTSPESNHTVDEHWLGVIWTLRLIPSLVFLLIVLYLTHYLFGVLSALYYTGSSTAAVMSQHHEERSNNSWWWKMWKWCELRAEEIISFVRYFCLTIVSVLLLVGVYGLFRVNIDLQHHAPATPEHLILEHKVLSLSAGLLVVMLSLSSLLLHRALLSGGSSNSTLSSATAPLRILARFLLLVTVMVVGCIMTSSFQGYVAYSLRQHYASTDAISVHQTLIR